MLYDPIISGIRTLVAALVGLGITALISWGITFPDDLEQSLNIVIFGIATAGYNILVNWLADNVNPSFGYFLGIKKTPSYDKPPVAAQLPAEPVVEQPIVDPTVETE